MPNHNQQNNQYKSYYTPNYQPQQPMYYQPNPYNIPQYRMTPEQMEYNRIRNEKAKQRKEIAFTGFILGCTIIAYLIGQVIISAILELSGLMELYNSSSVFQCSFTAIGISLLSMSVPFFIMSRILKRNYVSPLLPVKKQKASTTLAWIGFGLGFCFIAQVASAFMIQLFDGAGYELTQPETNDPDSVFACIIMFITIAVVPAIFEEFSLRCCAMGALKKYGKGFAVFIASVVFGLMHMNLIQFVFAFLIGLVLGYITMKTDNVIPAMLIHGINNSVSVISTILNIYVGEKIANIVYYIIIIIWIVVGVIGTVALFVKKEFHNEKKVKSPADNHFIVKSLCALPGLLIPILLMLFITSQSIVPKA